MTGEGNHKESELIRRFNDGDEEAFSRLFEPCEALLIARTERLLSKSLKRRVSVADILQEARIIAFDHRHELEYRGPNSFRNWLIGIVENRVAQGVYRHVRTLKRSVEREISRDFRIDTSRYPGNVTSPSQAAIGSEMEDMVVKAMETLPEDYRLVLHLTRVDQLSFQEIAEQLGRTPEAVRKLYGRALHAFTNAFDRSGGGNHG